jgi:hypothetical protein
LSETEVCKLLAKKFSFWCCLAPPEKFVFEQLLQLYNPMIGFITENVYNQVIANAGLETESARGIAIGSSVGLRKVTQELESGETETAYVFIEPVWSQLFQFYLCPQYICDSRCKILTFSNP